jgi:hypothetical protein
MVGMSPPEESSLMYVRGAQREFLGASGLGGCKAYPDEKVARSCETISVPAQEVNVSSAMLRTRGDVDQDG